MQALHNLCVVYVEQGLMKEAEECLQKAFVLAPHEKYIKQHLQIVHAKRLQGQRTSKLEASINKVKRTAKSGEIEHVDIRT